MRSIKWNLVFCVIISLIIFLIYSISLNNPFYWDDEELITNNHTLRAPLNFKNYFFSNPIPQRPVVTFSFAIDYSIFRLNPSGYHVTNIFLHICNTILVFYIASLLFKSEKISILSGIIFAFHPIHTEAVNLFLGRSDLLCSLFFLLSFVFYIRFSGLTGDRRKLFYYFSLLSFVMSLLSKEMAVIFPFLLIAYDKLITRVKQPTFREKYTVYIPYFLLSFSYLIFWYLILYGFSGGGANISALKYRDHSIYSTFLTQIIVIKKYLKLLLIPVGLSGWYEVPVYKSLMNPEVFFTALFFGFLIYIFFYKVKRNYFFPVMWLIITLIPLSNIIPIPGSMMAERWLYIPSAGFCILIALITGNFKDFIETRHNGFYSKIIIIATAVVLISYPLLSFIRNLDFNDELIFFKKLYYENPSSRLVRSNLGLAYLRKNNPDEAIRILEPLAKENNVPFLALVLNNLAGAYEKKGYTKKAEKFYKAAINIKPGYADAHINLGSLYLNVGENSKAAGQFKEVIRINPYSSNAHYNLGLLFFSEGKDDEAIKEYKESLKMRPDLADAHSNLGLVYYKKGLLDLAEIECKKAIELNPDYYQAYGNLGLVYMDQGKEALALQNFKKLLKLNPDNSLAKKYIKDIQAQKSES